MRYIIIWSVLVLAGCAGASGPPAPAEPEFSAIVDELESDISDPETGTKSTVSEKDAVRRQIEGCWNVPIGAPNPEELIVEIRIQVNRDGTVKNAVVVDSARMATDKYFRTMANSAIRAFQNPHCSRLKLPPEKYDMWKEITLTFDPSLMVGR